MKLERDRKGRCWVVSHRRCGVTEYLFLTPEELQELGTLIRDRIVQMSLNGEASG